MKRFILSLALLFWVPVAIADGGNESGHGGDQVVRDLVAGWQLALKMVKDVDAGAFQMDNEAEEKAVEFFLNSRDQLYDEILNSPQQWVEFTATYSLCGYTEWKHYAPFLMSKKNCQGTQGDSAAAHFIGEGTHHLGHGDVFVALVANLVVKAYHEPSRGPAQKRALEFKLIHEAALGNFNEVHSLLDPPNSVSPNCKNTNGQSPLCGAALAGDEISVNLLLGRNAYVDTRDSKGLSVFAHLFARDRMSQITEKHRRIALKLVQASLDKPSVVDEALRWAAALGDSDLVTDLLALGTTPNGRDRAFLLAMQEKRFSLASLLLAQKIHPPALDVGLRRAMEEGQEQLALQILQTTGVDLSLVDPKGRNAIFPALEHPALLKAMLQTPQPPVDQRDHEGWKPLGLALAIPIRTAPNPGQPVSHAKYVLVPVVDIFPSTKTKTVGRPDYATARDLIQAGADVTTPVSPTGTLPLTLTAKQSLWPEPDLVKLELSRGAKPDVPDSAGFTAFDWICSLRNRYVSACRHSPHWNPDCLKKYDEEIFAMQKAVKQTHYRTVTDDRLAAAVPNTRTGPSENVVRISFEPEPITTYDFTQWCIDARTACR